MSYQPAYRLSRRAALVRVGTLTSSAAVVLLSAACGGSTAVAVTTSAAASTTAASAAPSTAAGTASAVTTTAASAATQASAATATASATAAPAANAPAAGTTTIDFLGRPGPTGHTGWYIDVSPKFEALHPGWKMNFIAPSGSVSVAEKFTVLEAGGSPPDAVWFGVISDGGNGPMIKGLYRVMDDLMARDKFDKAAYFPASMALFQMNGKQYGIPVLAHYGCNILYINQDLVQRAQVQIPVDTAAWDTTGLITAAQQLTNSAQDTWGWWPALGLEECGTAWLRTFGGDFFTADGSKTVIDSTAATDALQYLADAQYKDKTIDDLNRKGGPGALFEAGKLAILQSTPGLTAEYSKPGQVRVKFQWTNTVMPKGPTGKYGTQDSGAGQAIATGAKHTDAAWEWVKFITNKENGVLQVQGGAGSPGARPDVWADPRLTGFNHIYGLLTKIFNNTPGPVYLPKNGRYFDVMKAANGALADLWSGKASARDTAQKTASIVNGLLALPMAT
ncbi:MAG TPA: extracellular solute-binding protein [Chloroflexota bacterium]|nr:extracellular solute-binding protein [Chloroflexota bacterium]